MRRPNFSAQYARCKLQICTSHDSRNDAVSGILSSYRDGLGMPDGIQIF